MRAVRLHGVGELRVEEIPAPGSPPPDGVVVRVRAAGICGSDLHNYRTGRWISRLPVVPGHELAGEIVEVGAEVVAGYRVGDLVVADSRVPCGRCRPCTEARDNVCERLGYVGEVCDGGFADFVTLPSARVLKVPPGISPRLAALSEPLSVALHVIRRLDPQRGLPILIAGAGPVGGLAALLLDHLGFGPLLLLERNEARANLVSSLARARVVRAEAAAIAQTAPGGLQYAIEATGSQAMVSLLASVLSGGGRLALVGIFRGECSVDLNAIVEREIDVVGCSVFRNEQAEALELITPLSAKLEQVISAPLALAEVPAEYQRLLQGESGFLKSMVCP